MQASQEWDKTFPKSEKVDHQKVTFKNRYGITLAADLYVPKIINNANHVDLYDRMDKIPFDKISEFFGKNLKQESEMTGAVTGASRAKCARRLDFTDGQDFHRDSQWPLLAPPSPADRNEGSV